MHDEIHIFIVHMYILGIIKQKNDRIFNKKDNKMH